MLPVLSGSEKVTRGLTCEQTKVFYKVGLIEIAGFICGPGKRGLAGGFCNEVTHTDDGGVLFWCGADGRPEFFLKGVLADIEL